MDQRVWLITGASTGFGRSLVEQAAVAGEPVIATARSVEAIADLAGDRVLTLPLDVTQPEQVDAAVRAGEERFGRIDVLVNNAGYGHRGVVEELSDADLMQQFDTNVFGPVRLIRAVLPGMRARRYGRIVQLSSVAGMRSRPGGGAYSGSKFALEGLSEALAQEVQRWGIKVIIVQPGPFRTDFAGRSARYSEPIAAYAESMAAERERFAHQHGRQPNDPAKGARIIREAVAMTDPPFRLPLGPEAIEIAHAAYAERIAEVERAAALGRDTAYDDPV